MKGDNHQPALRGQQRYNLLQEFLQSGQFLIDLYTQSLKHQRGRVDGALSTPLDFLNYLSQISGGAKGR